MLPESEMSNKSQYLPVLKFTREDIYSGVRLKMRDTIANLIEPQGFAKVYESINDTTLVRNGNGPDDL